MDGNTNDDGYEGISSEDWECLKYYGEDLVKWARNGEFAPVIGRDDEIRSLILILSRKTKNNPILIGQPGVGKTAVIEGLAQRIADGDVPDNLKDCIVFSLDLAAMMAGASYQGQYEERLLDLLYTIKENAGRIILFIDEIHTIMDKKNTDDILKPLLTHGDLHCIGATTINEYREYIEADAALARRFQPVMVEEPSIDETISMLRGVQEYYENYHGVQITDNAIVAAANLSARYITDRYLPDKAIDLIDEACASVKIALNTMPAELDELNRRIVQLQIEADYLEEETDEASMDRLHEIQSTLEELQTSFKDKKTFWKAEQVLLDTMAAHKLYIAHMRAKAEQYAKEGNESMAQSCYESMDSSQREINADLKALDDLDKAGYRCISESVTADEIAEIVSRWTGINVTKLTASEKDKVLGLEDNLRKRVNGQDEAVTKVAKAIKRSKVGLNATNRPIASFFFLGPTGVGKTELAKTLAEALLDDESKMIRLDMSEYREEVSVTKLIGPPPGYVGYNEPAQLTEPVRRNPYTIVLFDEVEKAHPAVLNLLLQILDDGRLTDSHGVTVNFKNTIIILTSNVASSEILEGMDNNTGVISDEAKENAMVTLRHSFKPEFLNRFDEIIFFKGLGVKDIEAIVNKMIAEVESRLADCKITISISDAFMQKIINEAYSPIYGARSLRRYIQTNIEDVLAEKLLNDEVENGSVVTF